MLNQYIINSGKDTTLLCVWMFLSLYYLHFRELGDEFVAG